MISIDYAISLPSRSLLQKTKFMGCGPLKKMLYPWICIGDVGRNGSFWQNSWAIGRSTKSKSMAWDSQEAHGRHLEQYRQDDEFLIKHQRTKEYQRDSNGRCWRPKHCQCSGKA
jgi:hypothetical protein